MRNFCSKFLKIFLIFWKSGKYHHYLYLQITILQTKLIVSNYQAVYFVANLNTFIKVCFGGEIKLFGRICEVGVRYLGGYPFKLIEQTFGKVG